jgi:hypothetical protein
VDESGGRAAYRADLTASLRAWGTYPLIPALSVAFALLTLVPPPWWWLTLPVAIFAIGWPGTERMLYLRAFRGLPLLRSELVPFTVAFLGRFFALGVVATIAMSGIGLVYAATADTTIRLIAVAVGFLALDVFLTFVTPALAFTTRRVSIAVRIGHRTLVDGWPHSAWYAFVPPLATVVVVRLLPETLVGWRARIALTAAGALLNLWFKGAVAAFYLRGHPASDDGAVHASGWEMLDSSTDERFRPDAGSG